MPRVVRKSLSRCSSRSSSRNSYRKRHSPKDHALSLARKALLPLLSVNRFNPLRIETPPHTPMPAPLTIQLSPPASSEPKTPPKIEQKLKVPKLVKLPEANVAPPKPTGIFQHGIRYILLPLHYFQLCVWGSPSQSSSESKEKKMSSPKSEKINQKSSRSPENKNPSVSSSNSSKMSPISPSSSGFALSSSSSSKSSRTSPQKILPSTSSWTPPNAQQIISVVSSVPSSSSFAPTVKSSSPNRKNLIRREVLREQRSDDSDEMVTAAEDLDDSSNEQWSNAVSLPSMNMSIDLDNYGQIDKSSMSSTANCAMEEPMDVSIEESGFYVKRSNAKSPSRNVSTTAMKNAAEKISETRSLSSTPEDKRSVDKESSNSSVDREITSIFQRACTSSSSDEEDCRQLNGRRNNPCITRSSNSRPVRFCSCFREEIRDAAIRMKRTSNQYNCLPEVKAKRINLNNSGSRSSDVQSVNPSKIEVLKEKPLPSSQEVIKAANQTDSAYSDEDVEMNSINESIIRLQSVHMQSLQESVVEKMDQDLEYVADTEDSNDESPHPGRTRISSSGSISSESVDQGFVESGSHPRILDSPLGGWKQISGLETCMLNDRVDPVENSDTLGSWNKISGLERSDIKGHAQIMPKADKNALVNWNEISGLQRSMPDSPIASVENGKSLGDWNKISGLETTMLSDPNLQKENGTSLGDWSKISGLEPSTFNGPNLRKENRTPLGDWNKISGLDRPQLNSCEMKPSSVNDQIAFKENVAPPTNWNKISGRTSVLNSSNVQKENGRLLGGWNEISGLGGSVNTQILFPQKANVDSIRQQGKYEADKLNRDVQVAGKSPPGFPGVSQHPAGTSCHCGNPSCFYIPLVIPAGSTTAYSARNYTKPPIPMRHHYCAYPEFMNAPAEASTGHQSSYVLIPVPASLVHQDLA